jgi:hypothetical protein
MKTRGQSFRGLWDEPTASAFPPRLRRREVGGVTMLLLDALAPGRRLASFSDSLEVSRVRAPNGYRIVEPVAQAVGKDRVVDSSLAPVPL